MKVGEERVLIDTNVLIYATLDRDPRSKRARDILLSTSGGERFTSVQNLAEMYPALTGLRMETPDSPATAKAKIQSVATLQNLQVLPLTSDIQTIALELCEKYGIARQKYYDAQITATMIVHGIRTLLTENERDFRDMTEIRVVNPFAA